MPSGDITFAGFSIGKLTGSVTGTSEMVGGVIAAYTPTAWNLPYNGTKIDKCIVFETTFSGANLPEAASLYLDAGKLTLTGPGLAGGSVTVPEINSGAIGPVYSQQLPVGSLVGGGKYTLSAAGGTQVDAFSASATLPNNFTTNASTINAINRATPLAITWTGTGFENVIISINGTTLSAASNHQVVITCVLPASQGSYSVPTLALSKLPAVSGGFTGIGSLAVTTTPALTGTVSSQSGTFTSLTPSLVGGGKVNYGSFAPFFTVVQSVTIQ